MANVCLIGATGNAGSRILSELARRGHHVTAVVRHPERVPKLDGVVARSGDANQSDALAATLAGHDVVVSSVHFLDGEADSLIGAVRKAGVSCYVAVGGAGSLDNGNGVRLIDAGGVPEPYQAGGSREPDAPSSIACARPTISTGRFCRRRRSSFPESVRVFSGSERTPYYATQTAEVGFLTKTTPWRWSTR
ncbi:putative NADH-flavin reductase [Bradyrhizobium sp. LM2.7]